MKSEFYSTNGYTSGMTFRQALLKGLAPDGGLFMPRSIPAFSKEDLESISDLAYHEIAALILNKFTGNEIRKTDLERMCRDAYNFDIPLEKIQGRKYIMRLDRGPTASFKDFAARLMSRLMGHFLNEENRKVTILTATSGDTGSAVASAFHGVENIDVIILFPLEEVTALQRKQMTTLGNNVKVLGIRGKFDHCQDMVKQAFTDESLKGIPLTSANSINIGRLLPQSVYYAWAWSRLRKSSADKIIFSVPSGNFGNLTAGMLASRMGIPVSKFIISTNSNDEVPEFLRNGIYKPVIPSRNCISSAMNVGHPSNLARIIALYGGIMNEKGLIIKTPDLAKMRKDLFGISVSDEETSRTIIDTYNNHGILTEPHGAVALKGLNEYLHENESEEIAVTLETAHPYKFAGEIEKILGFTPRVPSSLAGLEGMRENYDVIENDYSSLKKIILQKA
jgi:threonine synthase